MNLYCRPARCASTTRSRPAHTSNCTQLRTPREVNRMPNAVDLFSIASSSCCCHDVPGSKFRLFEPHRQAEPSRIRTGLDRSREREGPVAIDPRMGQKQERRRRERHPQDPC